VPGKANAADVPVEFGFGVNMDSGLREEILSILKGASDMTIATLRPDGYPQVTTVSYVSDGLIIYFGCAAESQKAQNIACNDKVSLTVTLPYFSWEEIRGLSMGGRARPVTDPNEINSVSELMLRKFPQILRYALAGKKGVFLVRITPEVISVLDYRKGFGHTDLVKL
jgi:general stress protein 26